MKEMDVTFALRRKKVVKNKPPITRCYSDDQLFSPKARKGYRTDATVSVLLGFLLFLIPARRPFSSSSSSCCRNTVGDSVHQPAAHFDPIHHVHVHSGSCFQSGTSPPTPSSSVTATISDMVKAGFGVNLIGVAVVMLAISTWGALLFNLNEFPAWAEARNVTGAHVRRRGG